MSGERLLMIFAKNPRPGEVKTRLAESVGDRRARSIYLRLLRRTRRVASRTEADRQIWFSRPPTESERWPRSRFVERLQEGDNLGSRMRNAFREAFEEGYGRVVIIGSDCPGLNTDHLEEAFEKLGAHQAVLGPSADGGYYLLGMNRFYPGLFDGIPWSTGRVLEKTLGKTESLGLEIHRLPQLNDVDTEADWQEARRTFPFLR